jgi:hypothetical protein
MIDWSDPSTSFASNTQYPRHGEPVPRYHAECDRRLYRSVHTLAKRGEHHLDHSFQRGSWKLVVKRVVLWGVGWLQHPTAPPCPPWTALDAWCALAKNFRVPGATPAGHLRTCFFCVLVDLIGATRLVSELSLQLRSAHLIGEGA